MSVVVRMEIPENCLKCPLRNQCEVFCDWFGRFGTSATRKPFPKPFDNGCRIVCQLPDGHGDLIDRDSMVEEWVDEKIGNPHADYEADDVIYDLKKRAVIVPQDKAHEP